MKNTIKPLVSIIVPVYNTERYLRECLDSLKKQDYPNLEIIIIDDGSTDDSIKICEEYSHMSHKFRLISKVNEGVSRTRNLGIKEARGEYLTFVDSDDFVDYSYISRLMLPIQSSIQRIDISIANLIEYHTLGYQFSSSRKRVPLMKVFSYEDNTTETVFAMMTQINSPVSKVFRRQFLLDHDLEFPGGLKIAEDLVFVFKALMLASGVYYSDIGLYYYRQDFDNDYSATGSIFENKALDFMKAFVLIERFLQEQDLTRKDIIDGFKKGIIANTIYNLHISEKNPKVHKKIFEIVGVKLPELYAITSDIEVEGYNSRKMKLILLRDYDGYIIDRLHETKKEVYSLIDRIEIQNIEIVRNKKFESSIVNKIEQLEKRVGSQSLYIEKLESIRGSIRSLGKGLRRRLKSRLI